MMTHLLTPSLVDALHLQPTSQFEVIDGISVVFLTRDGQFYSLPQPGVLPVKGSARVDSFAVSTGLIVVTSGDRLGWYEDGKIRERIKLPSTGMQVAAGANQALYVYDQKSKGNRIYFLQDGKVAQLVEIRNGNIAAFATIGERMFFASGNAIYTAAPGENPALLFVAEGQRTIRSLAADPNAGLVYFSAGEAVYAMRAGVAISILRGMAGFLRYSKDALFVLDPEKKRLVKVVGLEKLTMSASIGSTSPPMKFKE